MNFLGPLVLMLAASTTGAEPRCVVSDSETMALLEATQQNPTPLGIILGASSDWITRYIVVRTTHALPSPGFAGREGSEKITYYVSGSNATCMQEIDPASCPALNLELRAYRERSYEAMHNRSHLRSDAPYHPLFAMLHAQDGNGNLTKIVANWSHPLVRDVEQTFSRIKACTREADDRAWRSR